MLKQGLLILFLFSATAYSQDVIYMKNGSIIKGNITEIGSDGDVDIELDDGEIFTLKEYNIKKITYEKKAASAPKSKKDRIATYKNKLKVKDAGPSTGYSSFSTKSTEKAYSKNDYNTYAGTPSPKNISISDDGKKEHNISIGSMARTYLNADKNGYTYEGIGLAYQYNFNKNYAFYSSYNIGKLTAEIRNGESYEPSNYYIDEHVRYIQIAGLLSTNNYKGWQFFTGLGLFSENQTGGASGSSETYDETYNGYSVHLGAAYSWETFVLRYRMTFDKGDDYPSGALAGSGNLHLSWNL